jgi:hypothetical protein
MTSNPASWTHIEASEDLRYFTVRYNLTEAMDIYADAEYSVVRDEGFVCCIGLVNNTNNDVSINFETGYIHEWERPGMSLKIPKGAVLIQADDYSDIRERVCVRQILFASNQKALEGSRECINYCFTSKNAIDEGSLYIRYYKTGISLQKWELSIDGNRKEFCITKTAESYGSYTGWKWIEVPFGKITEGEHQFSLRAVDYDSQVAFDCFVAACKGFDTSSWVLRVPELPMHIEYSFSEGMALLKDRKLRQNGCFVIGADQAWSENFYEQSDDTVCVESLKLRSKTVLAKSHERTCFFFAVSNARTISEADVNWRNMNKEGFESIILRSRSVRLNSLDTSKLST